MNRYKLVKAGIDVNQGIWRFSGNKDMYEKCLNDFLQDDHYLLMLEAIENKDVKAAFAAAHALKGLSGNLSLNDLYNSVVPIVEVFRKDTLEGTDELLPAVKTNYERVQQALKE